MNKDEEHLKLLAVFHYVLAGVAAFFACFPILHLLMGIAMLAGAFKDGSGQGPPSFVGWMFIVMALVFITMGWAFAICLLIAGLQIAKRKHYLFCFVIAAFSCIFMPFGTVLGVFTIIVLMRPSVKELFSYTQGS